MSATYVHTILGVEALGKMGSVSVRRARICVTRGCRELTLAHFLARTPMHMARVYEHVL
jgi:hypothetical protein